MKYFHGKFGQTIGKMALKIKVMDISETRTINFKQALRRESIPLFLTMISIPHTIIQIINGTYHMLKPETIPLDTISLIVASLGAMWGNFRIINDVI